MVRAEGRVWPGVAVRVERDVVRHVRLRDLLVGQQRVTWTKSGQLKKGNIYIYI